MIFNSIEFAIFLPLVFLLYWFATNHSLKLQNALILTASYVFYGWWDWRFLSLIFFSSLVDYFIGIALTSTEEKTKRKLLLLTSITVNLGLLGFFKYFNFFTQSFADAFTFFGHSMDASRLNIILPVGISFYTFQTLSYSIDVYNKKMDSTKDFLAFFAFVSFFPQLVAGPIERASNLLPQLHKKRTFDYSKAVDGMHQILWGLFKKIVIADNTAIYVNDIFGNYGDYSGSTLMIGAIFFTIQIYCDFSAYSDIAIGTSKLFGIDLMRNFAFPFFSRDIAEFWRKWHISLTTWFRDYVYIPLGGSRGGTGMKIRNTFIVFLLSGFWHGANWTFMIWGVLHAAFFIPLMLLDKNRVNTNSIAPGKLLPGMKDGIQMLLTFFLVVMAFVIFRADNFAHAYHYLADTFSSSLFKSPMKDFWAINTGDHLVYLTVGLVFLFIVEWLQRDKQHGLELQGSKISKPVHYAICYLIIIACFMMNGVQQEFIYFQF